MLFSPMRWVLESNFQLQFLFIFWCLKADKHNDLSRDFSHAGESFVSINVAVEWIALRKAP